MAPKIYDSISSGLTLKETLNKLVEADIKFIETRVKKSAQNMIMNERVTKRIWGKSFAQCRDDFFIKPLVEDFRSQGIDFILGEGTEKIDPQEILNLLDRRLTEKFIIGGGTQELGLIERLALSGLKGYSEISQALGILGLFQADDKRSESQKAHAAVMQYVMNRWGADYRSFSRFVTFLRNQFLG